MEKLLKAIKNGFYTLIKGKEAEFWKPTEAVIEYDVWKEDYCLTAITNSYLGKGLSIYTRFWLKDYGNTWVIKEDLKEEMEEIKE